MLVLPALGFSERKGSAELDSDWSTWWMVCLWSSGPGEGCPATWSPEHSLGAQKSLQRKNGTQQSKFCLLVLVCISPNILWLFQWGQEWQIPFSSNFLLIFHEFLRLNSLFIVATYFPGPPFQPKAASFSLVRFKSIFMHIDQWQWRVNFPSSTSNSQMRERERERRDLVGSTESLRKEKEDGSYWVGRMTEKDPPKHTKANTLTRYSGGTWLPCLLSCIHVHPFASPAQKEKQSAVITLFSFHACSFLEYPFISCAFSMQIT